MQKNNEKVRLLVLTAVLLALIYVLTAFLQIPLPAGNGYIHLGDTVLCLAAAMLPTPYAIAAASIGEALADVTSGYAIFAPATLVIKAIMVLFITARRDRFFNAHNAVGAFAAGLVGVWLYFFYEAFLYHSFITPWLAIPMELVKCAVNAVAFLALARAFDRIHLKNRLSLQHR